MKKGTKLYSILKFKCPHCHEGDFFVANPYVLSKAGDLHEECPVCHRKYSKEPGFYYGAMYVAYAITVAVFVAIMVGTYIIYPAATYKLYLALILIALIVGAPYYYALSKIIWANMFYKYKGVELTEEEKITNQTK